MSQLQKRIERIQKREGPRLGFGPVRRENPPALLVGAVADGVDAGREALAASVDFVLLRAEDGPSASPLVREIAGEGACIGAWVNRLDVEGAEALRSAGCDFVVSGLATTASAAVDCERMGQVVLVDGSLEDAQLRAMAPIGLDGLLFEGEATGLSLKGQLDLVRLAVFAACPLMVTVGDGDLPVAELRALRDSGTVAIVARAGAGAERLRALSDAVRQVPPPRKSRRGGQDVAIVPSMAPGREHDHEEEPEMPDLPDDV